MRNLTVLSWVATAALVVSTLAWSLVHEFWPADSVAGGNRQRIVLSLALMACVLAAVLTLVASAPPSRPGVLAYVGGAVGIVGGVLGSRSDDPLASTVGYVIVISAIALISCRFLQANS